MANNKVQLADGTVLIDLTDTTATADTILQGYGAYAANGEWVDGTAVAGAGSAVTVIDEPDGHGGTIRHINAVSLAGDTVRANVLLQGYTAHNAIGELVVGTATGGEDEWPIFDILNDSQGHEISITCNKTFAECGALFESQSNQSLSAIVRETGETSQGTPTVWDHAYTAGVYNKAVTPQYIRYYATNGKGVPQFQLTYYSDGTITNEATDLDALVSLNVTQNGTYSALPDHVYDTVTVNVSAPEPSLQTKSATPSETAQTITPDTGYDGLSSVSVGAISSTYVGSGITRRSSSDLTASGATVTVPSGYYESQGSKSIASGTATAPTSISGTTATVSTGKNTLTLTKTVSVTPRITTAGYISSGTAGNSSVSLSASITTKAAATITPTKSAQTIASGTYLTGTQTIAAIPSEYIVTTDATASAADINSGATAYVNGSKVTGTQVIQTYRTGSSAPSSSLGNNGDLYLQVVS